MNDKQIEKRAEEIAHENSSACKNRPAAMSSGHGRACKRLAKVIVSAMQESRDT